MICVLPQQASPLGNDKGDRQLRLVYKPSAEPLHQRTVYVRVTEKHVEGLLSFHVSTVAVTGPVSAGGSSPHHEARAPWTRRRQGVSTPADETEGRSGLTIDDRPGGRYLGIPPREPHRAAYDHPGAHEIGNETRRCSGTPDPGVTVILDSGSHINVPDNARAAGAKPGI